MVIGALDPGGAERVLAVLANHWVERDWAITVVTVGDEQGEDFYRLGQRVQRISLRTTSWSKVFKNVKKIILLRRVLLASGPDVVIGFMPSANILASLACIGTGFKCIGSEHTHPPLATLPIIWRVLRRVIYPRLGAVTVMTSESAEWLKTNLSLQAVSVIPNPVTFPIESGEPELALDRVIAQQDSPNLIISVGRLVPEKGFDRLLAAFRMVRDDATNWSLVIVGEGSCREALERQIDDLGLRDSVYLPGLVGNLGDWYCGASIFVTASRVEGFGNTLVEAMTYGLPVIAMDCDVGPRNIILNPSEGILIPDGDVQLLNSAIQRVIVDEDLRAKLSQGARAASKRYSVGAVAESWERLIEEIAPLEMANASPQ